MLKLNLQKEPYWINLPAGVKVLVRPLTSAIMNAAQSSVIKEITSMRKKLEESNDQTPLFDLPNLDDEQIRFGLSESLLVREIGKLAVIEWQGVMQPDSEIPAEVNEKTISELLDIWFVAQAFWKKYTDKLEELVFEGNASRLAQNGTSLAGQVIAKRANKKTSVAAKALKAS